MQIYLAGPMTGLPDYNYPAFHRYAAMLRDWGYTVTNPAENPAPPCGTWEGYMAMALPQVRAAQLVVFLPGWKKSRGAKKEHALAQRSGIPCLELLSHAPPLFDPTPPSQPDHLPDATKMMPP